MFTYDDIIDLPRPVQLFRKRMPILERAAQFAPFAALSGFEDKIGEEARLTSRRPAVSDEDALRLSCDLTLISRSPAPVPVRLAYFVPDASKTGGAVFEKEGEVRRLDEAARELIFTDKTIIPIDDIFTLAIC